MYLFLFQKAIAIATQHLGLQRWPAQKEKIIQLYDQLQVSVDGMLAILCSWVLIGVIKEENTIIKEALLFDTHFTCQQIHLFHLLLSPLLCLL